MPQIRLLLVQSSIYKHGNDGGSNLNEGLILFFNWCIVVILIVEWRKSKPLRLSHVQQTCQIHSKLIWQSPQSVCLFVCMHVCIYVCMCMCMCMCMCVCVVCTHLQCSDEVQRDVASNKSVFCVV